MSERKPGRETLMVHGGEPRPRYADSLVYPIFQSTVYAAPPGTPYDDLAYIRLSTTPSQKYLHGKLAALEGAEDAVATASGMAALTTALASLMKSGDHLIAGRCLYGGTQGFLLAHAERMGWSYTTVDTQAPETWEAAARPETRVFLCETISNPLMRVPPLDEVVHFARERGIVTLLDNTFASPVNFRPLEHGFDLAFHSASKYLNGHSDIVAGCLVGSRERIAKARKALNLFGGTLDPHAGFLLARGIKTLAVRMSACQANAEALARFLAEHPGVSQVNYPGLDSHPDHAHARKLLDGFSGMLSFRHAGGPKAAERLLGALRVAYAATSLGGVESLVTLPCQTSHAGLPAAEREAMGITDDLIRVSCGIESTEDLIEDFRGALEA